MKKLRVGEITRAVGGKLAAGDENCAVLGVSTDSRTVKTTDLFFPLIGERFDAHDFIDQALDAGCRTVVISKELNVKRLTKQYEGVNIIKAADTTRALQDLASFYLSAFSMKKIGVTGSTGKTTTKEMLYHIFSQKYKTARNKENLNNHIGLPLTVLSIEEGTEVGIFEMGMDQFGEIDRLVDIVRPDAGIITNIGTSHIENLGSREGILKAKLEITNYFNQDSVLIINEDDNLLTRGQTAGDYRLLTAGESGRCDFILSGIKDLGEKGITFFLEHKEEMQPFILHLPGRHNAYNAAVAAAAAVSQGMTLAEAATGLEKMESITDKRLSIKGKNGMKIIDDTYNASPDSMKAALDVLTGTGGIRKIAILGDMFELGPKSPEYHFEVGSYAAARKVDLVICVGQHAKKIAAGAETGLSKEQVIYRETKEEISDLIDRMMPGDVILVKGSRGMAMDEIVKRIMEKE